MKHYGKYIFPTHEKALEMLESLQSTEENPCFHIAGGLIIEKTADATEDTEAEYSDRYQLDVIWHNLPNEGTEEEPAYDHPYGWKKYEAEVSGEGNHKMGAYSYQKYKL